MNRRRSALRLALLALALTACRGPEVKRIYPVLAVGSEALEYGVVKVGAPVDQAVVFTAQVQAPVSLNSLRLEAEGPSAGAFSLHEPPAQVPALSTVDVVVVFRPPGAGRFEATLVVETDDPDRPEVRIPVGGDGAHPALVVVPRCDPADRCRATVTSAPERIDFGDEPLERAVPVPVPELPQVLLHNDGPVRLVVSSIGVEGADAAAFTLEGAPVLFLEAGQQSAVPVRFVPQSADQLDWAAELVVRSDDPTRPEVRVELVGKLGQNLPPRVCANISRVKPKGEDELLYDSEADWAPLRDAPAEGYDFTTTRDVRPLSVVRFSAFSAADDRLCTSDPEDRRLGLSFSWTVTAAPASAGAVELSGATGPSPYFVPVAAGEYEVSLAVTDAQGNATSTRLRFAVTLKRDLTVQLSWNGAMQRYAGVDLDVHLVRPSAVTAGASFSGLFDWFQEENGQRVSGDLNGYAWSVAAVNAQQGFGFDWGEPGPADDPRLNLDEDGQGDLVEIVSLNGPGNDPACATADCTYKVFVHYFDDRRQLGMVDPCSVSTGCEDGEACGCASPGDRCVADTAPKAGSAQGPGGCYPAPEPVVQIFFGSSAVASATIPLPDLDPADQLLLGAPCLALYVADVVWPARDGSGATSPQVIVQGADATGRITAPVLARFGQRQTGILQCSPNVARGGATLENWYGEAPR
jgi:hypothetical protein